MQERRSSTDPLELWPRGAPLFPVGANFRSCNRSKIVVRGHQVNFLLKGPLRRYTLRYLLAAKPGLIAYPWTFAGRPTLVTGVDIMPLRIHHTTEYIPAADERIAATKCTLSRDAALTLCGMRPAQPRVVFVSVLQKYGIPRHQADKESNLLLERLALVLARGADMLGVLQACWQCPDLVVLHSPPMHLGPTAHRPQHHPAHIHGMQVARPLPALHPLNTRAHDADDNSAYDSDDDDDTDCPDHDTDCPGSVDGCPAHGHPLWGGPPTSAYGGPAPGGEWQQWGRVPAAGAVPGAWEDLLLSSRAHPNAARLPDVEAAADVWASAAGIAAVAHVAPPPCEGDGDGAVDGEDGYKDGHDEGGDVPARPATPFQGAAWMEGPCAAASQLRGVDWVINSPCSPRFIPARPGTPPPGALQPTTPAVQHTVRSLGFTFMPAVQPPQLRSPARAHPAPCGGAPSRSVTPAGGLAVMGSHAVGAADAWFTAQQAQQVLCSQPPVTAQPTRSMHSMHNMHSGRGASHVPNSAGPAGMAGSSMSAGEVVGVGVLSTHSLPADALASAMQRAATTRQQQGGQP